MPPKRTKSATGSAGVQRWEQAILSTPFVEEDKWSATVAFVVGNQLEDYAHIEVLAAAVNAGTRKLFSIITKEDLYNQVNELGNPKSKKAKEVPLNYEVCEPCKDHLDAGEDIPVALLAKLLKFRLLDIKQRDLKRRENEKKSASEQGKGKKGEKKERGKSPAKGGKGGKKTPEPPSAKEGSKLKKRGDEDNDSKYIDDEPDDGTDHYVFVSGFHEPHLISLLSEVGVNIDSLIKVTSEDYTRFEPQISIDQLEPPEKDEKQLAAEEEANKATEKKKRQLKRFWKDILLVMQAAPDGSHLHDVTRLEYIVKNEIIPENLEDNELKTQFGVDMYEHTACMLYDILDAKRQWKNFMANLKIINIPTYTQPSPSQDNQTAPTSLPAAPTSLGKVGDKTAAPPEAPPQGESDTKLGSEVDLRYYTELMNNIPQESVSVPLVMHCMLEQITASEDEREPPSETPLPPRADGLQDALAQHINTIAFKLALSDEEQQAIESEFEAPKKPEPIRKQPLLLNYRDDTSQRLGHLKEIDGFHPMKCELEMMGYLPIADALNLPTSTPRDINDRRARLQELIHFCATGGTTAAEVDHAFKQFVLECMDLRKTDGQGQIQLVSAQPQVDIPYDDPYPFFKAMIPQQDEADEGGDSRSESGLGSALSAGSLEARSLFKETPADQQSPPRAKSPSPHTENALSRKSPLEEDRSQSSGSQDRPGSAGILKRSASAISKKSISAHSVHFERDDSGNALPQPGDGLEPDDDQLLADQEEEEIILEDPSSAVNDVQKRNLDQWCFAEHLEPRTFLQVLSNSLYSHPFVDSYYHKRDNTVMVVLHNPYSENLQSQIHWSCELHSNVGFRNYLEHIAGSISEWTLGEEAKYQAQQLAKEVETIQKEADEASSRPPSGTKKRDRSKSPKKSPSRSGKSPSRSSSQERPQSANPFVRQGSLKAWKEEQDRLNKEEEEKEKLKQEKRARSATKRASKEQADEKEKKEKRSSSRSSSKTRHQKEEAPPPAEQPEAPVIDEPYWPFQGYDMGNQLMHCRGTISSLFPADGGQIRTEKYEFIQGTVGVKTCVLKDGHTFMVHVLDPKVQGDDLDDLDTASTVASNTSVQEDGLEKGDSEKSEKDGGSTVRSDGADQAADGATDPAAVEEPPPKKPCVGRFGSFSAQLVDGMSLALSTYGGCGEPVDGKKYEPKPYVPPPVRSASPMGKEATSPGKGKKGDKGKDKAAVTPEPPPQEEEAKEEVKEEIKIPEQPFQQLQVTCPDGLSVNYYLESAAGIAPEDPSIRRLLVRQSYPFPTRGVQPSEAARKAVMEETSRTVNSDGTVVKVMKDGMTQVLYATGGVSQFCLSTPLIAASRSNSPQRAGSAKSDRATPSKKNRPSRASARKKEVVQEQVVEEVIPDPGYWITTAPSGERVATTLDGNKVPVKSALVCKATDPQTKQVMFTRDDHSVIVQHPDGTTIVEHGDGTRITTFISEILVAVQDDQADETGEEPAVEKKEVKLVQVECPGYATLRFDSETSECSTEFATGTIVNTFMEGSYDIYHSEGGAVRIQADGTAIYQAKPNNDLELLDQTQQLQYVMRHFSDLIVESVDNQGNIFTVLNTGDASIMMADGNLVEAKETHIEGQGQIENEAEGQGQIEKEAEEKTDEEKDLVKPVIKTRTITHYKQHAPKFFIVHPDGSGTELLRYQDVSEFIANAEDDPATAILMDPLPDFPGVLGITIMRPYMKDVSEKWIKGYTQTSIMPPGLTSRDLTTLPARELKSEGPKFGTNVGKGLAVGSLVRNPPAMPVIKCPSTLEIRQLLQFKPVSEELRNKLGSGLREYAEHVQARMEEAAALQVDDPRTEDEKILAADLQSQVTAEEGQTSKLDGNVKQLYNRATAPGIPSPPPTPQPKRTQADWDRDTRELTHEAECRRALRQHDVPPYFQSELGKSFLLTQAPDMDALAKQLAEDPRKDGSQAIRSGSNTPLSDHPHSRSSAQQQETTVNTDTMDERTTSPSSPQTNHVTIIGDSPAPTIRGATGNTPSALRPGAPTPHHAEGQGSPTALRPQNPTPAHATKVVPDRPVAPTPATRAEMDSPASTHATQAGIPEHPNHQQSCDEGTLSTELNPSGDDSITGETRIEGVPTPAYIWSGKPGARPNTKFSEVEDPVRRKVYTCSVTGATPKGSQVLSRMRGFQLLPNHVNFGVLREGSTYNFIVLLKNTGIDSCRFKVKQPPPSTGMKVLFNPGPVAAGMKVELTLEVYAIAVGVEGDHGVGSISHDLEIITETDSLYLPISATVLTAHEYENRGSDSPKGGKAPGVKHVSNKPPGGQGIIRPRKVDKNGKEVTVAN